MRDQKHRNAYKRFWRNMRNAERLVDQATDLQRKASRARVLAFRAYDEMRRQAMK